MQPDSFRNFYAALAAAAGQQAPVVAVRANGAAGFSLTLGDVVVTALHVPVTKAGESTVFFFIDLGPMPAANEAAGWEALMERNFELIDAHGPCFSRKPGTGEVLLQKTCRLDVPADAALVLEDLAFMATLARQWRHDGFMPELAGLAA